MSCTITFASAIVVPSQVSSWAPFAIGFAVSLLGTLPMTGPLAVLVVDRGLGRQTRAALVAAAVGSAVEGTVAFAVAYGLPRMLPNLSTWSSWVRLAGSLIVACVGLVLLLRPASTERIGTHTASQSALSGAAATALNPTLFASWSVVVALLRAQGHDWNGAAPASALGLGVALGSFAWLAAVAWMTRRMQSLRRHRQRVVRCLGGLMAAVGLWLCSRAAISLW